MTISDLFIEDVGAVRQKSAQETVHTLLLVDDEPKVLSALKRSFRQESYRILTANSAAEALEIMQGESVELIISDHRMPSMTGAELLTTVRERWPETIRIMLTGYADVQSIMGAVNDGAVYKFMTKPWLDDDLRVTVARALEQYDLQKEVRALRAENHSHEERLQQFSSLFSQERGLILRILLREDLITQQQHDDIIEEQQETAGLMYHLVLNYTGLTEEKIAKVLCSAMSMESIDLREVRISPEAAGTVPPAFCRANLMVPIRIADNRLTVAMADPSDIIKRQDLEAILGLRLNVVVAGGSEIEQKINATYGSAAAHEKGLVDTLDGIDIVIEENEEEEDMEGMLRSSVVPPVVRIVNAILAEAMRRGASDIHIEPRLKATVVRYRMDGLLQHGMELPGHLHAGVISRIKVQAGMDIAEKRRPQDGRITLRTSDRMVDLKVSSLPTVNGENLVLKVQDRGGVVRRIKDLDLNADVLVRIRAISRKPQGLIICTGPSGSGKTTMLHALLREHLEPTSVYGTIEDPVEYTLENASQVLVREEAGLTFPVALRSMLRQDPDVILVGETRDKETAQLSFHAALTGHLVLSTLHAGNAVTSITQLADLGVERHLIASGLECVIAQRLLRAVCPKCAHEVEPDPQVLRLLSSTHEEFGTTTRGAGCDFCNQTGYHGRVGIFEVLEPTDTFRDLVLAGARESELSRLARQEGMGTLFEDAMTKVNQGKTTLEETLRVLGPRLSRGRHCPECGEVIEFSFNVCPKCGCVVRHTCPGCGEHIDPTWEYCSSCGKRCETIMGATK